MKFDFTFTPVRQQFFEPDYETPMEGDSHYGFNPNYKSPHRLAYVTYQAWHHTEDIPKPVCTVTLGFCDFVEWCEVLEECRRQGIATEVLQAIEEIEGELELEGVTEAGKGFEMHWYQKSEAQSND